MYVLPFKLIIKKLDIVVNGRTSLFRTKSLFPPLRLDPISRERGGGDCGNIAFQIQPNSRLEEAKKIPLQFYKKADMHVSTAIYSCCCKLNNVFESRHVWTLHVKVHLSIFLLLQLF